MLNLMGGKGANLAEMCRVGCPVPPGFTITTEVCTYYYANNNSYPADLKRRISGKHGHLSNDDAAEFAAFLAENGTKRILLFHLSEENNTPELAIKTVKSAINNDDVIVMAADKDETVEIL